MRSGNVCAKALRAAAILAWLAALIFIRTPAVSAQQSDDLQQQIKQLKQEYERAIADFQKRLAALEQKAAEQRTKATEPGTKAAAPETKAVAPETKATEQETKAASTEKHTVTVKEAAQEIAKSLEGLSDEDVKKLQEQTTTDTTYVQLQRWGPASGLPSSWGGGKIPPWQ
jgi:HD-GYP domain-containing protein (c-di-GMP phosphodiesterase class II)